MIITDDAGDVICRGTAMTVGRLKVRGPCITSAYYRDATEILDADGYFDTNDIATIDPDGTMHITDRSKDIIKSGGEWISSIEIENLALGHPAVAEAAVIGVAHEKWSERPLLIVVPKPGERRGSRRRAGVSRPARSQRWWIPDDVQYVAEIPHTAAGKINKVRLARDSSATTGCQTSRPDRKLGRVRS